MIKSAKGVLILSVSIAVVMIVNSFSYIEFTGGQEARFSRISTYLVTLLVVYNAGFSTQKYIQTKKEK